MAERPREGQGERDMLTGEQCRSAAREPSAPAMFLQWRWCIARRYGMMTVDSASGKRDGVLGDLH